MISAEWDSTRLNVMMSRYVTQLGIPEREVIRRQSGLLIKDIVRVMPPRNLSRSRKKTDEALSQVFSPPPPKIWRLGDKKGGGIGSEFQELYASPELLVSTPTKLLGNSGSPTPGLVTTFYNRRGTLGPKYTEGPLRHGWAQRQKLIVINRIIITKSAINRVKGNLVDRIGKMKASFCFAWDHLKIAGKPPAWVSKHVTRKDAKGSFADLTNLPNPEFDIESNASGISGKRPQEIVRGAMRIRAEKMMADLRNQLSGKYQRK